MCSSWLCDTRSYVTAVENEYRKMWLKYCNQQNGTGAGDVPHLTLVGA
jgi:hypothetical protein